MRHCSILTDIQGGCWNTRFIAGCTEAQVIALACDCRLKCVYVGGWPWRTGPFTCGIGCYLQVDRVRTELSQRPPCWCLEPYWLVGVGTPLLPVPSSRVGTGDRNTFSHHIFSGSATRVREEVCTVGWVSAFSCNCGHLAAAVSQVSGTIKQIC